MNKNIQEESFEPFKNFETRVATLMEDSDHLKRLAGIGRVNAHAANLGGFVIGKSPEAEKNVTVDIGVNDIGNIRNTEYVNAVRECRRLLSIVDTKPSFIETLKYNIKQTFINILNIIDIRDREEDLKQAFCDGYDAGRKDGDQLTDYHLWKRIQNKNES